jgi:hypothetical protein
MKARHWLQGCGAGILIMLRCLWLHISPLHADLYHRMLPLNAVYWGVLIDLTFDCLLFAGIFWLLERYDPGQRSVWRALLAALLLSRIYVFIVWMGYVSPRVMRPQTLLMGLACVGLVLCFWKKLAYSRTIRAFQGGLALLGVSILWMAPQLVFMAVHPEPHENPTFAKPIAQIPSQQRRIVWVVFDELSQDQMLDHRQPDIDLPQLDRFRSQSVMFSDLKPAGYYTELVLPSLLWGKVVTGERSNLDGVLSVKTTTGKWQRFPANQSIFADAQRDGWSAGVAGWYNPYCRTYAPELDWCAWKFTLAIPGDYSSEHGVVWNVFAPLRKPVLRLLSRKRRLPSTAAVHAADYKQLMQWSHELIADENIRFVFLHLPLPHPDGFYNRHTGQLGVLGSYLDNLVLTDQTLGELMQWIGQTKSADQTTVIVCSDHSWRVPMWRNLPEWTREDATVSEGRFDPRPVLMVHFPEQTTAKVISQPFPALKEHDLVDSLLRHPMDATGLEEWVHKQ